MALYRLYTENKINSIPAIIKALTNHGFNNANLFEGIGLDEGTRENCIVVEVIVDKQPALGDRATATSIALLAESIRQRLKQRAVKVVKIPCESSMVVG